MACDKLANHGATVAALEAIFGWAGGRMASLYIRKSPRTHPGRGTLKWQIVARPLTVY